MELHPEYPIRTARLLLRPLELTDIPALLEYRGRADVCHYLPFEPQTEEILQTRLTSDMGVRELTDEGQRLFLGVELADSGRLIGDVMLSFSSLLHRGGELGWAFNPEVAGQGYATEAAQVLLRLAFEDLGLHRVTALMVAENDDSARLAERLGMRREALFLSNEMFKGEWSNEAVYALLADEWRR